MINRHIKIILGCVVIGLSLLYSCNEEPASGESKGVWDFSGVYTGTMVYDGYGDCNGTYNTWQDTAVITPDPDGYVVLLATHHYHYYLNGNNSIMSPSSGYSFYLILDYHTIHMQKSEGDGDFENGYTTSFNGTRQ